MEVLYQLSYRGIFRLCGGGRIRTSVGEAGRFTVCSLWPLGHTPGHAPAALCAERPNMVANETDFSTDEKGLRRTSKESPGRDSNPRPAAYKAAALPLSYPGLKATGIRLQVTGNIAMIRRPCPSNNAILPSQAQGRISQANERLAASPD